MNFDNLSNFEFFDITVIMKFLIYIIFRKQMVLTFDNRSHLRVLQTRYSKTQNESILVINVHASPPAVVR